MKDMSPSSASTFSIHRYREGEAHAETDRLVVEEPMEIRLAFGAEGHRARQSLAITMRTPGHDFELALGFLYTEGIIAGREDVVQIRFAGDTSSPQTQQNVVLIELRPEAAIDSAKFSRHFYTTSSCGICGKASLEMVQSHCAFLLPLHRPLIAPSLLIRLPHVLLDQQRLFSSTGGVHAAALFDASGALLYLREDVGRHNAVDKVIGAALQSRELPLHDTILLVSGRAGFELVQKALMAGIPFMAAIGAPSSLAVELAEAHQMTLIGFLRDGGFNIYTGHSRILLP